MLWPSPPGAGNVELVALVSQDSPSLRPSIQVPSRIPSFGVVSPVQYGQGSTRLMPRKTTDRRLIAVAESPVSTFTVPLMSLAKRFTTQTGVLPAESGKGGPR